ncbi:trypsin-like peptidase domain-containing protein [Streptomyces sp. NPDC053429]|uniref:nSTAND1 domain-containing NTPase n=1 Tax=Streptomyces sp. NPDC053429 TaxID=3365702 RepID=UPI0037D7E026
MDASAPPPPEKGSGQESPTAGLVRAVAQVLGADDQVAGAGFLVAEGVLMTCSHVVRAAGAGPGDRLRLAFPHVEGAPEAEGLVVADAWRSPGDEDVAVIRLLSTDGDVTADITPAALGSAADSPGHRVYSFGFPSQAPVGGHFGYATAGRLLPATEERGVHLQLTEANDLATGFSGGPVVDEVTGLVIGMLTEITAPDEHARGQGIAYVTPAQVLREVWPDLAEQDISPYRGLESFTAEHAEWFEGRTDAVRQVLANLAEQRRVTLLLGPSGSGKSSLVQAGVLPALAAGELPGSDRWLPILARPRQDLLTELERAGLAGAATAGIAEAVARKLAAEPGYQRVVLVIDQYEELLAEPFTPREQERRLAATDEITAAITSNAALDVIMIMRDDFYPQQAALAPRLLEAAMPGLLNIPSTLSQDDLHDIIVQPALKAGARFEPGLPERVIADVLAGTPDGPATRRAPVTVLPMLELTLDQLWQRRREGVLTHDAYRRIGGVTGSLTTWCDAALDKLPAGGRPVAQRILTSLVRSADTRRSIPAMREQVPLQDLRELAADVGDGPDSGERVDDVLAALAHHRIIVTHTPQVSLVHGSPPAQPVAELIHDALIRDWGTLRAWVRQDHRFKEWLDYTRTRRARWEERKDAGDLLAGTALAEGIEWAHQRRLPAGIQTFLSASEQHQEAAHRRSRRLNAVLAALLVLALLAAGGALWQWRRASDESRTALSRQVAGLSDALIDTDPDTASLLAVQAYRTRHTPDAVSAVEDAASLPLQRRLAGHTAQVNRLAYSPDGHTLATGGHDGTVRLWDTTTGRNHTTFPSHGTLVWSVAFSPDGRTLATGESDRTARLWDIATQTYQTLEGHGAAVYSVAFSPDGRTLATGGKDKTVRLWDLATRTPRRTLKGHTAAVSTLAFSPDGRTLATCGPDKTARLWDVATGAQRHVLKGHGNIVYSVAFSPDGRTLASASHDGTVRLWDVATGKQSGTPLAGHTDKVNAVAFSPDGRTLASAGYDNAALLWDIARRTIITALTGHYDAVVAVAFSPDGRTLATGSFDFTARLWDIAPGKNPATLTDHKGAVRAVAFSPNGGHTLATGSFDGTIRLWDLRTRKNVVLKGHTGAVYSLAYSPDGRTLASVGNDGTLRLWDVTAHRKPTVLARHYGPVYSVAFSSDRHTLATGGFDGTIRLWDIAAGNEDTVLARLDSIVYSVALSPDGQRLAAGVADNTVRLWDVATRKGHTPLTGHTDHPWTVVFSPDGALLASGGRDTTVRLWDVAKGQSRAPLTGHSADVVAAAFSPDGRTLVTGGQDGTVRLWDVPTDNARATVPMSSGILSVAVSPNGRTIAAGGGDATTRLWDMLLYAPDEAIERICHAVNRDLTHEQRKAYLPDPSVGPVCSPDR